VASDGAADVVIVVSERESGAQIMAELRLITAAESDLDGRFEISLAGLPVAGRVVERLGDVDAQSLWIRAEPFHARQCQVMQRASNSSGSRTVEIPGAIVVGLRHSQAPLRPDAKVDAHQLTVAEDSGTRIPVFYLPGLPQKVLELVCVEAFVFIANVRLLCGLIGIRIGVALEEDGTTFGAGVVVGEPLTSASLAESVPAVQENSTLVIFMDGRVDWLACADDTGGLAVYGCAC
jgi:hypothetical protein